MPFKYGKRFLTAFKWQDRGYYSDLERNCTAKVISGRV